MLPVAMLFKRLFQEAQLNSFVLGGILEKVVSGVL